MEDLGTKNFLVSTFLTFLSCSGFSWVTATCLLRLGFFSQGWGHVGIASFLWMVVPIILWQLIPGFTPVTLMPIVAFLTLSGFFLFRSEAKQVLNRLKLTDVSVFLGVVALHYGILALLGTTGPAARYNNDAFHYVQIADYLSEHGILDIPTENNPLHPVFSDLHQYSPTGLFRNGLVIVGGFLIAVFQFFGIKMSGLYVIPAIPVFAMAFACVVAYRCLTRNLGLTQLQGGLSIALLMGSHPVHRLYWESFYPATMGLSALICAYCISASMVVQESPQFKKLKMKDAFFFASGWWLVCLNLYPETIFFVAPMLVLPFLRSFKRIELKPIAVGILAIGFATLLSFHNFLRFLNLFRSATALNGDVSHMPWEIPGVLGLSLGQIAYNGTRTGQPQVLSMIILVVVIGTGFYFSFRHSLKVSKERKIWGFTLLCLVLPGVMCIRSVIHMQAYSASRVVELSSYGILFGAWVLFTEVNRRWSSKQTTQTTLALFVILIHASWFRYPAFIRGMMINQVYPTKADYHAIEQMSQSRSVGVIGGMELELSLFPNHFFIYATDLWYKNLTAFVLHSLTYFYPHQSSLDSWLQTESFLVVSRLDCMNKNTKEAQFIAQPSDWLMIPLNEAIEYQQKDSGCFVHASKGAEVLFLKPKGVKTQDQGWLISHSPNVPSSDFQEIRSESSNQSEINKTSRIEVSNDTWIGSSGTAPHAFWVKFKEDLWIARSSRPKTCNFQNPPVSKSIRASAIRPPSSS